MGFLDRITKRKPTADTQSAVPAKKGADNEALSPARSVMALDRRKRLQDRRSGMPTVKAPLLPPAHAATLIACTTTKRAYWVVFKQNTQAEHGWEWQKNIPAVPASADGRDAASRDTGHSSATSNDASDDLKVGGRDWRNWRCSGCGQAQIPEGKSDYAHFVICNCGMYCCLGPGAEEGDKPRCPNCNRTVNMRGTTIRGLPNTRYKANPKSNHNELSTHKRRELED